MEELLSYAVKEDIIKTVLRNHNVIFLSGWSRTGKTISLLKSLQSIDMRLYFSHSKESQRVAQSADPDIQIIGSLSSFRGVGSEESILIIDDFSTANEDTKQEIIRFLSERPSNLKIVLIVRAFIDIKNLIPLADALLRLKKSTAEIIYSIWQERGKDD